MVTNIYNVTQFYFGTYAPFDTIEAQNVSGHYNNDWNESTQVPGFQPKVIFTAATMRRVTLTQNDTVREGNTTRLEEDDFKNRPSSQGPVLGADSFTYNLGSGAVTSEIDAVFTYKIRVTRVDGTSFDTTGAFVQLQNGAIFSNFMPGLFTNQKIKTIELLAHDNGAFYGTEANRSLTGVEIVCFAEDVLITTDRGKIAVGELEIGDLVLTRDRGLLPIRWMRRRRLGPVELQANARHLPIRIKAGALGQGLPHRDLRVSPQHRILVRSRIAERLYAEEGVLIAAKHLLDHPGIAIDPVETITYVHFAFERHELVFAEGAPVESFYPGPMAIAGMDAEARAELLDLFPELDSAQEFPSARRVLNSREGRNLVRRHEKNRVALLSRT